MYLAFSLWYLFFLSLLVCVAEYSTAAYYYATPYYYTYERGAAIRGERQCRTSDCGDSFLVWDGVRPDAANERAVLASGWEE